MSGARGESGKAGDVKICAIKVEERGGKDSERELRAADVVRTNGCEDTELRKLAVELGKIGMGEDASTVESGGVFVKGAKGRKQRGTGKLADLREIGIESGAIVIGEIGKRREGLHREDVVEEELESAVAKNGHGG